MIKTNIYNDKMNKVDNGITLTNDEVMEIITQLEAFDILLCREILDTKSSEDDELMNKLKIIGDIGMIKINRRIVNEIYHNTENITACETFNRAKPIIKQAIEYKALITSLYEEAINENKN